MKLAIGNWKFKEGFTLIELLIVVAIMAMLSGAILYSTNNTREKGRDAKRKDELEAISTALTLYYTDNNQYPLTADGSGNPILDYSSDAAEPWIPNLESYLEKLPKDPLQAAGGGVANLVKQTSAKLAQVFKENPKQATSPEPQVAGIATERLYPTGDITTTWSTSSAGAHWSKLLYPQDFDSSYVYAPAAGSQLLETLTHQSSSLPGGTTITQVTVCYSSRYKTPLGDAKYVQSYLEKGAQRSFTAAYNTTTNYFTNCNAWTTNPFTSAAWTVADINDPNFRMGLYKCGKQGGTGPSDCPNSKTNNTEIRVSDMYMEVYYNTGTGTPITISGTVETPESDGVRKKNKNYFAATSNNNIIGYSGSDCSDGPQEGHFEFKFTQNQGLIHNTHIDNVKINFNPKIDSVNEPAPVKTRFRASAAADGQSDTIASSEEWAQVKKTKNSATWDSIGAWNDPNTVTYDDPQLKAVIQELVDEYASQGISLHFVKIFWEVDDNSPCGEGITPENNEDGNPPTIEIIYSNPETPSCTANPPSIYPGETANFFANGGNGTYTWNDVSGGGTIVNASDNRLQITYPGAANTTKSVTVTSNGNISTPCSVTIGTAVSNTDPGAGSSYSTACNNKSGVFCYRVSLDKKHFVLWAQLENLNDPQIYNSTSGTAACTEAPPTGSLLNYCLKSPE